MAKSDDQDRIAQLEGAIVAKDAEMKTLYALVNRYKKQITDLDIEIVKKDIEIGTLQQIVEAQSGQMEQGAAA